MSILNFTQTDEFIVACNIFASKLINEADEHSKFEKVTCALYVDGVLLHTLNYVPETDVEKLRAENIKLKKQLDELHQKEIVRIQYECHRGND